VVPFKKPVPGFLPKHTEPDVTDALQLEAR